MITAEQGQAIEKVKIRKVGGEWLVRCSNAIVSFDEWPKALRAACELARVLAKSK